MDKQHMSHELNHLMSRILEVRYTDLEEEKKLCRELLEKTEKSGDTYGQAFAYTFLGDYYIAINDVENSGAHLLRALELSKEAGECGEVTLRIYSLLGMYYEHKADEQNSIQCYLEALTLARRLKDIASECSILNNMGFSFQRHGSNERALEYFRRAYELQKTLPEMLFGAIFAGNLAEILIDMNRLEEALSYMREVENSDGDPWTKQRCLELNWCLYYAKAGEPGKCLAWAQRILDQVDKLNEEKMYAFENYNALLQCMMDIGNEAYARRFLELQEAASEGSGIDQLRLLEKKRIAFCLQFEPEEKHFDAYKRFYQKMQEFKDRINNTISSAMKAKIQLDELSRAREKLQSEQRNLQHQYDRDELTGSYNRRYLESLIRKRVDGGGAEDLGIVMVDVDYFKEYNDYYKHIKGDEVLKIVATCLDENKVEGIYPCRFGGDEFTCVCSGVSDEQIDKYVASVRAALYDKNIPHEKSLCSDRVTLSIGIAAETGEADPYYVLELADRALYESKQKGRNAVTWKRAGAYE